jgi:hypothetical protein
LSRFANAQRVQQIPGEDHLFPAPSGWTLLSKIYGALLQRFIDLAALAQIAQPLAAADR